MTLGQALHALHGHAELLQHTGHPISPVELAASLSSEYLQAPVVWSIDQLAYASFEGKPVGGWRIHWSVDKTTQTSEIAA